MYLQNLLSIHREIRLTIPGNKKQKGFWMFGVFYNYGYSLI